MSKLTLYTFSGSVWASAPALAVLELGYGDAVELKTVNLAEGENFRPEFLAKNPNGTLPTLETPDKTLTSTTDVIKYLVDNAPVKVKHGNPAFIKEIHEDKYDPNFALLMARDDEELAAKASGFPAQFVANRQQALEQHSANPDAEPYKAFYDAKKAGNGGLLNIYQGNVPEEVKNGFFEQSKAHLDNIRSYLYETLPKVLAGAEGAFLGGAQPGEDDFHLGAWLTRIAATSGAQKVEEGPAKIEAKFGQPLPAKVLAYWNAWVERASWNQVYGEGLH
ncbi:hypothetical protein HDZ31DRAFT_59799 [Schizophyllum fasciatum]